MTFLKSVIYRDYFMENARARFLFMSWVVSENEWAQRTSEFSDTKQRVKKIVQSIFHAEMCLFHKYGDLSTEMTVMKKSFCFYSQPNSDAKDEKSSFAASDWTNDVFH